MSPGPSDTKLDSPDGEEDTPAYLLRDETADINKEDAFGHYQYVQTLSETIQEVDPPWHIGLFGRWGTGKSSILEAIEDDLPTPPKSANDPQIESESADYPTGNDRIEYIEFDAWKHAEDSIRTEFLLRIDEALARTDDDGLGESAITETLLDVSVAEEDDYPTPPAILEEWEWVWHQLYDVGTEIRDKWVLAVPILVLGLLIGLQHAGLLPQWVPVDGAYGATLVTALGLPLFIQLFREVARNRETYQRQMYPRKDWSGAYETLFEDILDEHEATYNRPDRYVIAVDNLDRCEPETVYDVLIAMKTFFEDAQQRCLYIVPCDDETLRQHVADVSPEERNEGNGVGDTLMSDEEEFLRKFFQTTIQLPPFEVQNVESFADEQFDSLVDDRQPNDRDGVLDVLTKANVQTPRRIKHTINRFLTLRTLAKELESDYQLKVRAISESEAFLMKTLVLKEDFPDVYEQIRKDPDRLTELQELATSHDFDDDPDAGRTLDTSKMASDGGASVNRGNTESHTAHAWDARSILHSTPALRQFLQQTQTYTENPRPFVFLNDAELVELYGQYSEFQDAIEAGDIATAREELETLPEELKPADTRELVHDIITRSLDKAPPSSNDTDAATYQEVLSTLFAVPATADSPHTTGIIAALSEFLDTDQITSKVQSLDFHPDVTWRVIAEHEQGQETRPHTAAVLDNAATTDLTQDSRQYQLLDAALQTVAVDDTGYTAFVGETLRSHLRELLSETDNSDLSLAVGSLLEAHPRAARETLSPPIYRAVIAQIPSHREDGGVNDDALELAVGLYDAAQTAPALDEDLTELTDELVTTVLNASLSGQAEIDTTPVRRLQDIDFSALSRDCGWEVHKQLSPLFKTMHTADTSLELNNVSVLTSLWLHAVFQIGSLKPVADDAPLVEDTFTTLIKSLQGNDFATFIETFVERESENDQQLGLLNKHPVLETYLEFVLDHVTDRELIANSLELVAAGELAPLEDQVEATFGDDPKKHPPSTPAALERWAPIAVEAPGPFEGIQEDFVYQCVLHLEKSESPDWPAVLPYPASQYASFTEQPAFQDRITGLIEDGLAPRRRTRQRASANALAVLPSESDSSKVEFITEAASTVTRAYHAGTRPAQALEELVLVEADNETTDRIHNARLTYLQSTARSENEQNQAKALSIITEHIEDYYAAVDPDQMNTVIEKLESRYGYPENSLRVEPDASDYQPPAGVDVFEELITFKKKQQAISNDDT